MVYHEEKEEKEEVGGRRWRKDRRDPSKSPRSSKPRLQRQSTFIIEGRETSRYRGKHQLNSTLDTGGIRAIMQNVNKQYVLPTDVNNYISSHLRMIRDENEALRRNLEEKSYQLDKIARAHQNCKDLSRDVNKLTRQLGQVTSQLDKEKAKTRTLMRRLKEDDNEEDNIVWFGMPNGSRNNNDSPLHDTRQHSSSSNHRHDNRLREYKDQVKNLKNEMEQMKAVS